LFCSSIAAPIPVSFCVQRLFAVCGYRSNPVAGKGYTSGKIRRPLPATGPDLEHNHSKRPKHTGKNEPMTNRNKGHDWTNQNWNFFKDSSSALAPKKMGFKPTKKEFFTWML
jgi:hypothetical protein